MRWDGYVDTIELSPEVRAVLAANAAQAQLDAGFTEIPDEPAIADVPFDDLMMGWTGCSPEGFALSMVLGLLIGFVSTWMAFSFSAAWWK